MKRHVPENVRNFPEYTLRSALEMQGGKILVAGTPVRIGNDRMYFRYDGGHLIEHGRVVCPEEAVPERWAPTTLSAADARWELRLPELY